MRDATGGTWGVSEYPVATTTDGVRQRPALVVTTKASPSRDTDSTVTPLFTGAPNEAA